MGVIGMADYRLMCGNCVTLMQSLHENTVNCCITSPPYFGLRDYGHDAQIGLEATPEAYVAKLVEVFRAVRRVMRADGTLWLNLGDSYAAQRGGTPMPAETLAGGISGQGDIDAKRGRESAYLPHRNAASLGLKHKDLIGIPWRVAFALQADGWYLRQDIIWHKPNPMPESVRDRCTKAHEYLFLFSKSANYFFDHNAIKEPAKSQSAGIRFGGKKYGDSLDPKHATKSGNVSGEYTVANKRSVWSVPTRGFRGAHFAVYPEALITPCVLAGSPHGGLVLDPFVGSGTTGVVSLKHGRSFIGCEINPEYRDLAESRIQSSMSLFT